MQKPSSVQKGFLRGPCFGAVALEGVSASSTRKLRDAEHFFLDEIDLLPPTITRDVVPLKTIRLVSRVPLLFLRAVVEGAARLRALDRDFDGLVTTNLSTRSFAHCDRLGA